MPRFFKKTTTIGTKTPKRKFLVHKPSADPSVVLPPVIAPSAKLRKVAPRQHELQNQAISQKASAAIDSLNSLLHEPGLAPAPEQTLPVSQDLNGNAIYVDEPEVAEFNGLSDPSEQVELYSKAVEYEQKRSRLVSEQLKMVAQEHDAEKKALENEIRTLKRELHRTVPIHDNKFFTLSKQLREAITEIETIAKDTGVPLSAVSAPVTPPAASEPSPIFAPTPQATATTPSVTAPPETSTQKTVVLPPPAPNESKQLSKKKTFITGAMTILILCSVGAVTASVMTSKPKVDEKLVAQYLATNGQVQGAQTDTNAAPATSQSDDPSQSNVTFEQSVWEEFHDPMFGILLQYPKNAVKPIRTDSNVTFIRKTGYLFKVQRIETALTLDEYWKQIKATSLNFKVTEEKFKGKPALKLELEDMADYPGDRILVKEGNFIYDIWYATPSNNFSKDDILRAEKMLSSLSIVEAK